MVIVKESYYPPPWDLYSNMLAASPKDTSFASLSSSASSSKDCAVGSHSPPSVTAESWSLVETHTGELIWGKSLDERLEIASLTKIMTACATLKILHVLDLLPDSAVLSVPKRAVETIGTTAGLHEGDKLAVGQLLYGLMLPSGNDAAVTLAEGCGQLLRERCIKDKTVKARLKKGLRLMTVRKLEAVSSTEMFVRTMNMIACKLGLARTCFSNPHGLADKANKSTADEVGRLVHYAKRKQLICKVVGTKEYKCVGFTAKGERRLYAWTNTNALLKEGYDGFKTGITPTAGPCLVATRDYRGVSLIITLLNCKSCEHRWKEAGMLFAWAARVIDGIYESQAEDSINLRKIASLFRKVI